MIKISFERWNLRFASFQVFVDGLLIVGALKRRPAYIVPWLCANSVLMGVLLVRLRKNSKVFQPSCPMIP